MGSVANLRSSPKIAGVVEEFVDLAMFKVRMMMTIVVIVFRNTDRIYSTTKYR